MQNKELSLIEAVTNSVVGYFVGVGSQMLILPLFGIHGVSVQANMGMAALFALTSIVRGYFVRRFFNYLESRKRTAADLCSSARGDP